MAKRRIILLENDDTVISQWQVFQPKDFDLDPKPFRYNEKQVIQSILSKLVLKTKHLGKRPRVCHLFTLCGVYKPVTLTLYFITLIYELF